MFNNVEKMPPEELLSELRRWHFCYKDAPDNFDARLIKRSIDIIEILLDKLDEYDRMYEERHCTKIIEDMKNEKHS